eukprot:694829-Rhodomonas_salina.8
MASCRAHMNTQRHSLGVAYVSVGHDTRPPSAAGLPQIRVLPGLADAMLTRHHLLTHSAISGT